MHLPIRPVAAARSRLHADAVKDRNFAQVIMDRLARLQHARGLRDADAPALATGALARPMRASQPLAAFVRARYGRVIPILGHF